MFVSQKNYCERNIFVKKILNIKGHIKEHGNEPAFSMFLHKLLWPRSLTLLYKPFRFLLRILGDIHIQKSTPRIGKSTRLP
jgi:hypothetical protein